MQEQTAGLQRAVRVLEAGGLRRRRYLDDAPVSIMIFVPGGDGRWIYDYLNRAAEDLYATPAAATVGRSLWEVWPGDVAADVQSLLTAWAAAGTPVQHETVRTIGGKTKFIECFATSLGGTEDGSRELLVCGRDVTGRRELEERVKAEMARNAEVLEREAAFFRNTDDVLVTFRVEESGRGRAYVYEAVSPKLEGVTGIPAERLIGHALEDCLPPDLAAKLAERNDRCVGSGTTLKYAETYPLPAGERTLEGALTPVRDTATGRIVRLVGWSRDITDRLRLEEERRQASKMEALGKLSAGVAHDFNNMLQAILGSLELALDDLAETSPAHELVSGALKSAQFGVGLTEPLLTYARQQTLWPQQIETAPFLADMGRLFTRIAGPNISVDVRMTPLIPALFADPGQLHAALMNLAANAIYAMHDGGTLTLDARETRDGGQHWVVLTVSDTGSGMDGTTLSHAADPFFTTKGTDGTGLGLSMVKGFVEQSGGEFHLASRLGVGTQIQMQLPCAKAAATDIRRPVVQRWSSGRVLIVDDSPEVLKNTSGALTKAGFSVSEAVGGRAALALLADGERFDAIVTDFIMPGISGAELIGQARIMQPGLPALVITGFADLGAILGLPRNVEVLRQPFQRVQLLQAIQQAMDFGENFIPFVAQAIHANRA